MVEPAAQPEMKIVMIGRSKAGKSSTGNTILGRKAFKPCMGYDYETKKCQIKRVQLEEQSLAVIDTPGLFGGTTSGSFDEDTQEKVMEKINQCLLLAPPGPVVFLVVLQLGSFTELEQQTVEIIQRSFGTEAAHYTMALFTRGDDLKREGGSVEEVIGADPMLRDFIRECRGGYHVFDNEDTDLPQVTELLRKINATVQRNGDQGVFQGKHLGKRAGRKARGGTSFMQACIDGGVVELCTEALRFATAMRMTRRPALMEVVLGGAVGGFVGAALCMVCGLILVWFWPLPMWST